MYTITEVFLDESGKYRARVIIDDVTKETIFLKFDNYPTQQQVDDQMIVYLDRKNAEYQHIENSEQN